MGRGRRNLQRAFRRLGPVEALIDELAPARSFLDVGAIWNVHGRTAFLAEERGASSVTALDLTPPTAEYEREHERRASGVRFVMGDLHDRDTQRSVGRHDVVWCSGVLYHAPNPVHTIECLADLTADVLVVISATVPEVPGVDHACVFFPALSPRARLAYDRAYQATLSGGERVGLTTPFDPARRYDNWWWGLTPSAVKGMLSATGFTVTQTKTNGFHTRVVARRSND
jgi:2-polyprenyl-3-methyl-5-hydroxy-6-metoxy-1,4-benzoquinol methylase